MEDWDHPEGPHTPEQQRPEYPELGTVEEGSDHGDDGCETEYDTDGDVGQLSRPHAVEEVVDPGHVASDDEESYAAVVHTQTQHVDIVGVTHQGVKAGGEQETGDGAQDEEGDDSGVCPGEVRISCPCVSGVSEVRNEEQEQQHPQQV